MENNNKILEKIKESIKNLPILDVENVVGKAVKAENGDVVFPLVKISVGYVGGYGEYPTKKLKHKDFPFVGASSFGYSVEPKGFLVIKKDTSQIITVENENAFFDIAKKLTDTFSFFVKKNVKSKQKKEKEKK